MKRYDLLRFAIDPGLENGAVPDPPAFPARIGGIQALGSHLCALLFHEPERRPPRAPEPCGDGGNALPNVPYPPLPSRRSLPLPLGLGLLATSIGSHVLTLSSSASLCELARRRL